MEKGCKATDGWPAPETPATTDVWASPSPDANQVHIPMEKLKLPYRIITVNISPGSSKRAPRPSER